MKFFVFIALVLVSSTCFAAPGHRRMVRRTGITPKQVGQYEGVGRSTRSFDDAVSKACYAGQKVPVSIQYSKTGSWYNAVVRYQ